MRNSENQAFGGYHMHPYAMIYGQTHLANIGQVRELVALRAKVLELDTEAL